MDGANNPQVVWAKLPDVPAELPLRRPLVVTADPGLLEELLRLCAASGVTPVVAADAAALSRSWSSAAVVLLDPTLAPATAGLAARPRVVVVGMESEGLWEVAAEVGADHVALLPTAAGWLVGLLRSPLADAADTPVLAVMGGTGGGGATTVAIALARAAGARGLRTLLLDGDPYSGGIDLALGMESASGDRWPQVVAPGAGVAAGFISRLPVRAGLHVLASDRDEPLPLSGSATSAVLSEARSGCDLVIADLPRRIDPSTSAVLMAASCTYLVVPAQVRAVAAAAQLVPSLREHCAQVRAIVRGPAPSGLSLETVTRSLRIPLAGAIRAEPGIARDYERGVPPGQPRGPLARLCAALLDQLDETHSGVAA